MKKDHNIKAKNSKLSPCKRADRLIPDYLDGKLGFDDTRFLIRHLKKCTECRDEMEIRFLINEGLKRVESGETLDLKNELERRLERSEWIITLLERVRAGVFIIEGTAAFVLAASTVILFF